MILIGARLASRRTLSSVVRTVEVKDADGNMIDVHVVDDDDDRTRENENEIESDSDSGDEIERLDLGELRSKLLSNSIAMIEAKEASWNRACIEKSAARLGYAGAVAGLFESTDSDARSSSKSQIESLFRSVQLPGTVGACTEVALVEFFARQCTARMSDVLREHADDLAQMGVTDRIRTAVRTRLEFVAPVRHSWHEALAVLASRGPASAALSVRLLHEAVDEMWIAAGDRSTDWNWYTKRAMLGGVYASTELFMLTDNSEGLRDTWDFLDRRLDDVAKFGRTQADALSGIESALNRLQEQFLPSSSVSKEEEEEEEEEEPKEEEEQPKRKKNKQRPRSTTRTSKK
jgi:rpsU-divergently transcribed protein